MSQAEAATERKKRRWISASTRSFIKEARQTPGYSLFDFIHGYVYNRWPYVYIGIAAGEHPLVRLLRPLTRLKKALFPSKSNPENGKRRAAEAYHAKVLTNQAARQLVTVREDVRIENTEQVIPYARARDIILKNPDHIAVVECPCRSSRAEPCSPLDVCLVVGEPFAGFIIEHHPDRARWVTGEEACEILEAEHAQGHVHHAFFNEQQLNRFFGICNCCSCCCVAMQAWQNGVPMLAASGYTSTLDADSCIGCGDCAQACPFGAIDLEGEVAAVSAEKCMGCGVCISQCQAGALSLARDPSKGEPLEIQELIAQAKQRADSTIAG
jgi:ferredoxin